MEEEILKEFDEKFGLTDNNFPKEIPARPFETYQEIRQFLIKAITKTREETIREVEEKINKLPVKWLSIPDDYGKHTLFNLAGINKSNTLHILNKLKK